MAAKKATAQQQFVADMDGRTVVVLAGARFAATDPIVKEHRAMFEAPTDSEGPRQKR